MVKSQVEKICFTCGNSFWVRKYRATSAKVCSHSCRSGLLQANPPKKGVKGRPAWNLGKKLHYDVWNKGLKGIRAGAESHLWKGGITPLRQKIRSTFEYRQWRKAVFERDNYTCVFCKIRGGWLEADHIKPFAIYPELRLNIENGRTLCKPCHKTTDTYGRYSKNREGVEQIWNQQQTQQS